MADQPELTERDVTILRDIVTDAVCSSRGTPAKPDYSLRQRLRRYERTAVTIGLDPQTVQVIRSARRLVGDPVPLAHDPVEP